MDVLANRSLKYLDDNAEQKDVALTIFRPYGKENGSWTAGFVFGPPIATEAISLVGIDFIQAFVCCLQVARGCLIGSKLWGRVHWQGMSHCGLPWHADLSTLQRVPHIAPSSVARIEANVLTNRTLGYRDVDGIEREIVLTIFEPIQDENGSWRCGFAFGPLECANVHCGVGADYLEAVLDALAMARTAFEAMAPNTAQSSADQLDCNGFPVKVGREFLLDRVGSSQ